MSFNRKLEIAHWNQGKGCKGSRKAKVRAYSQSEIDAQIAEQDESYRTRHISTGHPNHQARLEYRIQWYRETLARYELAGQRSSFENYLRDSYKKALKELEELK